ncbi:MAG: Gfo/Idh/MocA family oxidoreductase [Planctomycetota bacterium]
MGRRSRSRAGSGLTRRGFMKGAAATGALTILPTHVWAGPSPNGKVNVACIGNGGRGGSISGWCGSKSESNIVALCDVHMSDGRTKGVRGKFPKAKQFQDFRKMFDEMHKEIDAVTSGTPDHAHFPTCMLAMSLGKGVYVEKPMAHTFDECTRMIAAEKKYKVACQMGNQGHSGNNYFQFKAWVEAGIIKNVRKVDAYMTKGRRWHGWGASCKGFPKGEKMPDNIDWDTWCGTAPWQDYSGKLHGGNWRCWYDYGNGAFGDWGPHTLDTIHEFLELGLPTEITAVKRDGPNEFVFPQATTILFKFPARGKHPACDVYWYDGTKNIPPRPPQLEESRKFRGGCGKVIYSDEFTFMGGTHSATVRMIPEATMKDMSGKVPKDFGRNSDHMQNWLRACQGKEKTRSSFKIGGELTAVFALGCIAQRLGGTLKFDTVKKRITNNREADRLLVGHPPRKGWEQYYKM